MRGDRVNIARKPGRSGPGGCQAEDAARHGWAQCWAPLVFTLAACGMVGSAVAIWAAPEITPAVLLGLVAWFFALVAVADWMEWGAGPAPP